MISVVINLVVDSGCVVAAVEVISLSVKALVAVSLTVTPLVLLVAIGVVSLLVAVSSSTDPVVVCLVTYSVGDKVNCGLMVCCEFFLVVDDDHISVVDVSVDNDDDDDDVDDNSSPLVTQAVDVDIVAVESSVAVVCRVVVVRFGGYAGRVVSVEMVVVLITGRGDD